MRVVVTGASGNVGTAVVAALHGRKEVHSVVGVCRRPHAWRPEGVEWVWADIAQDDLTETFRGADSVIHLSWLFQPMRDERVTWDNNVTGSRRVFDTVASVGVPSLVHASSVGAYSPRHDDEPVDESYPTDGVPQAAYSREKAYLERVLDGFELEHPDVAVARMRPAFIFRRSAAAQQRRLFLGPVTPRRLMRPGKVPLLPLPVGLRLQAVATQDVADAYATAALTRARGAFNLAAEPLLDPPSLAELMRSRWIGVPAPALRTAMSAAYAARLLPAAPQMFDLLMSVPVMSSARAHDLLGWHPHVSAADALRSFLEAPTDLVTPPTPPLSPSTSGPLRSHEIMTGLGSRP